MLASYDQIEKKHVFFFKLLLVYLPVISNKTSRLLSQTRNTNSKKPYSFITSLSVPLCTIRRKKKKDENGKIRSTIVVHLTITVGSV